MNDTGTVVVKFDLFGRPVIKGRGFSGGACKEPLSIFNKAIGADSEVKDTAEMHQMETTTDNETDTEYA